MERLVIWSPSASELAHSDWVRPVPGGQGTGRGSPGEGEGDRVRNSLRRVRIEIYPSGDNFLFPYCRD